MSQYATQGHEIELTIDESHTDYIKGNNDENDGEKMVFGFDGKMHRESSMHHSHVSHPEDAGGTIVKYGIVQKGWPFQLWQWKKVFLDSLHQDVAVNELICSIRHIEAQKLT